MVTEAEQIQFNFTIIREGLRAIAAASEEQLCLNRHGLEHLDDVFDPMPLDYLAFIEQKNEVSPFFASQLRDLYREINQSIGHLEWQEQDAFIAQNTKALQQWRHIAQDLLSELNGVKQQLRVRRLTLTLRSKASRGSSRTLGIMTKVSLYGMIGGLIALSVAAGYAFGILSYQDHYFVGGDDKVFAALMKISAHEIPKNNGTCMEENMTVGRFLSSYLYWSFYLDTPSWRRSARINVQDRIYRVSKLSCEGVGIQQCTWLFGNEGPEGVSWSTVLKFRYDEINSSIDPEHVSCQKW